MATVQSFLVCDTSTVANYVATGSGISAAIGALGFVKTSDTGQVVWGSVTTLPNNTTRDYEIWKPTDALQTGASQFFIKVGYGNSGSSLFVTVTLGTGTSGAGGLTGNITATSSMQINSQGSSASLECDFSGDGAGSGRFACVLFRSGVAFTFGWERTVNTSGNPTATGVTLFSSGTSLSSPLQQSVVFATGAAVSSSYLRCLPLQATETFGGTTAVSPLFPDLGYFDAPLTGLLVGATSDYINGFTFSMMFYGATHTYMCATTLSRGITNSCILVRYE